MFPTSTQRKHWMYSSPEELDQLRLKANKAAGKTILEEGKVEPNELLTPQDELYLVRSYLVNLKEFCRKFLPTMKKSVIGTAFTYMKRFYLRESCMLHHPRDIGVTCAYLACKVDEFYVTIDQFLKNINGDCRKAQKTILSNELLLMQKLNFHLAVHLPYRPVEGFLIDLRARHPPARDKIELMSLEIDDYLDKSLYTDACFLYTPSQIALAAVCNAADKCNLDLSKYLEDVVFADDPQGLDYMRSVCDGIKRLIERDLQDSPGKEVIKKIEKKMLKIV